MKRLVLIASLLLAACQSPQEGVLLPPIPKWRAPRGNAAIPAVTVAYETRMRLPGIEVSYSDQTYTLVNREWLDEFVTWTWKVSAARKRGVKYVNSAFDCENFTGLFRELASLAVADEGIEASPLIADVLVQYDATQRHYLNGVATDMGPVIVEPNPGFGAHRITPLDKYQKPILAVNWGTWNRPY